MRFYNSNDLQTAINRQEVKLAHFHYAMKHNPEGRYTYDNHLKHPTEETLNRAYERLERLYSLQDDYSRFSFYNHFFSKSKKEQNKEELYVASLPNDYLDIICTICDKKNFTYKKEDRPANPNYTNIGIFLTREQKKSLMYLFSFNDIEPDFTFSFSCNKPEPIEDIDEPADTFLWESNIVVVIEDNNNEENEEEDDEEELDEGLHEVEGYMTHDAWDV